MPRLANLLVLSGVILLATWVWAPAAPSPEPRQPREAAQPRDQSALILDDMAAQIDRLRERVDAPPNFPPPQRNPFRFGTKAEPISPAMTTPAPEVVLPPPPPPRVLPKLLAIVANDVDGTTVRTAVLSVNNSVVIVKVGDTVEKDKYVVRSIASDVAVLVESSSGETFELTLR